MEKFNLDETIKRLLTPRETLAPWLFDENNQMHENMRLILLRYAQKLIESVISPIEGLEVTDITLTGSSSGYFYKDSSDIDMRVEVHNKGCKWLAKDSEHMDKFLATQLNGFFSQGYSFHVGKRLVDIKISSKQIDFLSLYSVKYKKWLIEPTKEINISKDEMKAYYLTEKKDIIEEYESIKRKYRGMELGSKLNDFFVRTVLRSIKNNPTIKDHITFKLLDYEQLLKPIGAESIRAYNRVLQLKSQNR
jgi:hypothetical protein